MTYEEFLEKVKTVTGGFLQMARKSGSWGEIERESPNDKNACIYIEWTTGGRSGGSCWGHEADGVVESEPEPSFDELDRILEAVCPQISFLVYKGLVRDCVDTLSGTSNDYYGNYTSYAIKQVKLYDLYISLLSRGLI